MGIFLILVYIALTAFMATLATDTTSLFSRGIYIFGALCWLGTAVLATMAEIDRR